MRTTKRDRCRSGLAALALAAILIVVPVTGLSAEYSVSPDGRSYQAVIELESAETFEFIRTGMLGERIPLQVQDVSLSGNCDPCTFEWSGNSRISFEEGDYTLNYSAPLTENHLISSFSKPYTARVILPPDLSVKNPLLGMVSPGAIVTPMDDGSTAIRWNETESLEVRFYDQGREEILLFFGNFWIILAIVLLLPFILTWRRRQG
ncbi:MAG TPA: DUF5803 family protein [Methanoregulaceae archaeon]|jgi:hypothetical protein|nr:hypothetical protein [Methanolinea sp.]MCC7567806.1 hypothetical protein [Methanoregulaceae archaeon]MDD3090688.1 DUF5803 family protein [Methanoregulaceae archaeon]MDD5047774.1 DUF5803 family protein [Methanoregulaceae archaeon]MDD5684798.1 DUF5803 family protein [Methanoregulaceae archaeon]